MWKCPGCGEAVDDDFEVCWKCQQSKPPSATFISEPREPLSEWASNFRESKQPNGSVAVEAFGRALTCGVCGNTTFRERTTILNTGWTNKSATNFICTRCGYIFWFFPL